MTSWTRSHPAFTVGAALAMLAIAVVPAVARAAGSDIPSLYLGEPSLFGADSLESVLLANGTRSFTEPIRMGPSLAMGTAAASNTIGSIFLGSWVRITAFEVSLLGLTATLPKDWTGWSPHFVRDGANNFVRAYTKPPVWDDDAWFHNYVGHPYGGNVYYNTVRCQGATPAQSILFATVMSAQWEYVIEAVAERPSVQDLIITPIVGSALGEVTHRLTLHFKKGGTTGFEKLAIVILNPTHAILEGLN